MQATTCILMLSDVSNAVRDDTGYTYAQQFIQNPPYEQCRAKCWKNVRYREITIPRALASLVLTPLTAKQSLYN